MTTQPAQSYADHPRTALRTAYRMGREARVAGCDAECPFTAKTLRGPWLAGWERMDSQLAAQGDAEYSLLHRAYWRKVANVRAYFRGAEYPRGPVESWFAAIKFAREWPPR